ncbi:unnamed protein product, partial [Prorocentrum cordatum]
VLDTFDLLEQCFALGEAFAPHLCFQYERALLAGASVIVFVDSLLLLLAVCKGSSKVVDFGGLVHAIHLLTASLRLLAWWEHVDSAAIIADGGSRCGNAGRVARRLGIRLKTVEFPPRLADMRQVPANTLLGYLESGFDGQGVRC